MSTEYLWDDRLSLKAQGLLTIMLFLPDHFNYSIQDFKELTRDGTDSIKTALKELENYKYLKRTPIREKGIIRDWQYTLYTRIQEQ